MFNVIPFFERGDHVESRDFGKGVAWTRMLDLTYAERPLNNAIKWQNHIFISKKVVFLL